VATLLTLCVPLCLVLCAPQDPARAAAIGAVTSAYQPAPPLLRPDLRKKKAPLYRYPASYRGVKKSPATKPAASRTVTLATAGAEKPDVYVDEAGTAHIVWNEGRGSAADVAVYCRLPRGATACDVRRELTWPKPYGAGDDEFLNVDTLGPRILRVGDQLVVVSNRFPTVFPKAPGARGDQSLIVWGSVDGGNTWSAANVLGSNRTDEIAVVGTPDAPGLLGYGQDPLCTPRPGQPAGQGCLVSYPSGSSAFQAGILTGPGPGTDSYVNLASAYDAGGRRVLAAMTNSNGSTWVRGWRGGPIDDPASWSLSAAMPGSEPVLATGPGGTFLMTRGGAENPILGELRVRRLVQGAGGVWEEQPPVLVASGGRVGRLFEDPAGRLHGVWIESAGVTYRSAEPGSLDFSAKQLLVPGLDNGQWRLGATDDGGGFVVLQHGTDQVVAAAFGNPAPTGRPGLAGIAGGGDVSCTSVGFGSFRLQTSSGCLLQTAGRTGLVVSEGPVRLNGLDLVPEPGSRLVFDPKKLTIDTVSDVVGSKQDGVARVLLRNGAAEIELFRGRLQLDLPKLKPGAPLFDFTPDLFPTEVLGFPVASDLPVSLTKDGVRIPVEVGLPKAFGGFTGRAVLLGTTAGGLSLESLDIDVGPLPLGVLTFEASVHWQQGGSWQGSGALTVAGFGTIEAAVAFESGQFRSADIGYTPEVGIAVGPDVFLTHVEGGLSLQPTTLYAGAEVSFLVPRPEAPITASGRFTMVFPEHGPGIFRLQGGVKVLSIDVAGASVEFQTDGYAQFAGTAALDFGPLSGQAQLDGFVDGTTGHWGASLGLGASVCRTVEDPAGQVPPYQRCDTGSAVEVAMSYLGLAACASDFGIAFRWDEVDDFGFPLTNLTADCDTGDYHVPPPRARLGQRDGGAAFTLAKRLPSATLMIPGTGTRPSVTVTGPDGGVLVGPGAAGRGVSMFSVGPVLYVRLDKPAGGGYTVTPQPGSSPVGQVQVAEGAKRPKVSGSVRPVGRGTVQVRWKAKRLSGHTIALVERGSFGTRVLEETKHQHGVLRVRPHDASGRKRTIEAILLRDGIPRGTVTLGHFKAPKPSGPRPAQLHVRHLRGSLKISLHSPRGAAHTVVSVKGSAGSRVQVALPRKAHTLVLPGFRWDRRITVRVYTVDEDGRRSPTRTVRLR
jgi:hypothetical protein